MTAARPDQHRQRSKSMLSFGSVRSRKSSGSGAKIDLTESSKDKNSRRMTSKADPSMAINEAQPAAQALEESTLESIRALQHRDIHGNIITDPDLSNPTRPRLERPLDTIRSFEAAIDGSYNRRFSSRLEQAHSFNPQSRRSSYLQNFNNNHDAQPRYPGEGGGYYGNRMPTTRPDSYVENNASPPGYHNNRRSGPRTNSEPALYGQNGQGVYPSHGYQQSYDTVTSASGTGSHGTDQWGNSTDPSSENSSIDKIHQVPKSDVSESYGFNGFGGAPQLQGPILEEHGKNGPAYGQPGYAQSHSVPGAANAYQGNIVPPKPPAHVYTREIGPKVPIKLGDTTKSPTYTVVSPQTSPVSPGGKRKSWLKRRFSKKD